jgi:hypothetical protein
MGKFLFSLSALFLLPAVPVLAQDPDPRAILEKAVKAHGGDQVLARTTASHSRSKGKIHVGGGLDFTAEEDVQLPDKFRSVVQLHANGMTFAVQQVFNGQRGWIEAMGMTKELDDKQINDVKEILHATRVGNVLAVLRDPNFKLAPLGPAKVKDKDAVGVRVSYAGRRDVNLYFDKGSGLLVKTEGRSLDPVNQQEVNQEKFFTEYRAVSGRQSPRKVEVYNDGKLFMEAEVLELRLLERHEESTFNKP